MTELLPCPFCGGVGRMETHKLNHAFVSNVVCANCYAQGGVGDSSYIEKSAHKSARENWNTRPTPAPQVDAWRTIDDAAKNGKPVLLCVDGDELGYKKGSKARVIGYWAKQYTIPAHEDVHEPEKYPNWFEYHEESGEWFATEGFYTDIPENYYGDELAKRLNPTHYMPLPQPPQEE